MGEGWWQEPPDLMQRRIALVTNDHGVLSSGADEPAIGQPHTEPSLTAAPLRRQGTFDLAGCSPLFSNCYPLMGCWLDSSTSSTETFSSLREPLC